MGSVKVGEWQGVIHAKYSGQMTMELVQQAAGEIEALLPADGEGLVLYDTLHMEEPPKELSEWMKGFDAKIGGRIVKTATVVPDYLVAAQVGMAFVYAKQHEVFYDLEQARHWLKS